jgi:threonine/homoserine/homoserine lactone efflux protein
MSLRRTLPTSYSSARRAVTANQALDELWAKDTRAYLSYRAWIDRAAGVVMFGLGIKLVTGAAKP